MAEALLSRFVVHGRDPVATDGHSENPARGRQIIESTIDIGIVAETSLCDGHVYEWH